VASEYYTTSFYEEIRKGSLKSAEVVVPLVLKLVPVRSVVDVGCGDGTWLSVFRKLGVNDAIGIDGDYVSGQHLQIPQDRFQAFDLSKPFTVGRTFDLAISLEVAEHLPADSAAGFVESLARLAPAILFSAAIPFQGGNHHVNEQWPDKWAALLKMHSYVPIDFIRKQVWQNEAVEFWYAQNTLLFVRDDLLETNAGLKAEFERTNPGQLCLVHPRQYLHLQTLYQETLTRAERLIPPPAGPKEASRIFLACVKNSIRWRLDRIAKKQAPAAEASPANRPPKAKS
jgi:SAM-dependent methyltransferase